MSRNCFSAIKAATLRALDGEIGSIRDLLFEDSAWGIRYLVVDTGKWLPGRKVLISPSTVRDPDWQTGALPVTLTRDQVKNSPDIDSDKPVSLQMQEELASHYGWPYLPTFPYWPVDATYIPPSTLPPPTEPPAAETQLRSCQEIIQYSVEGLDGEIGQVEDLIVNTLDWRITLIVVKTGGWFTGREVLLSATKVDKITWGGSTLSVNLSREQVEGSPEFDWENPVDEEFEKRLLKYYGKPPFGP